VRSTIEMTVSLRGALVLSMSYLLDLKWAEAYFEETRSSVTHVIMLSMIFPLMIS
jgi:hypothetical protein